MGASFDQFIRLLASETGNLTYHLVLSFSIALAFSLAMNMDVPRAPVRRRRTLLGLALLLLMQFGLFIISGLTWQAVLNGQVILPPLDRAVSLLSLVVIVWLWCFPDSSPVGDAVSILLSLVVIVGTVLSTLMWSNQPESLTFNGTMPDIYAAIFGVGVAVLGIIVLLTTQVDGYWFGFGMLLSMAAGFGLHLALLPYGGDYPSIVRLGQMIAFPFLALLTQRYPSQVEAQPAVEPAVKSAAVPSNQAYDDPVFWQDLTRLSSEKNVADLGRDAAAMLAHSMRADLCVLLDAPETASGEGTFQILGVYNRLNGRSPDTQWFSEQSIPVISNAWRNGRNRRISSGSSAPDLSYLANVFDLRKIDSLLFTPILSADGKARTCVLLAGSEAGKDWSDTDQEFLTRVSKLVVQFLQRNREMAGLRENITQARQTARLAQDQAQQAMEERQKFQSRVVVLNENAERDRTQIASLTSIAAAHEIALHTITELQEENSRLKEMSEDTEKMIKERDLSRDGEMRLALQEIAMMQQSLYEADVKITSLKMGRVDTAPSKGQLDSIAAIARDLRLFLDSIKNNNSLLLDEVGSVLDTRQRKRLQRTNATIERMDNLISELERAISPESNRARLELEEVDIRALLQRAVIDSDARLRRRRISVKLDLPADSLKVISDRHALKSIMDDLLENAGLASPEGSQVVVRSRAQTRENEDDFVLIQVIDSGAGIPAADFVRVFAPRPHGEARAKPISGLGKSGADLPQMKTLVEAMGGYTWVDSILGRGATFSVMLPSASSSSKNGSKPAP